jgi:hypothetical protein
VSGSLALRLLLAFRLGGEPAPQELVHVQARVVSVSGASVYLDVGREAGVLADDRVLLLPSSGARVDATIRDVSKSTSRAEFAPGSAGVAVGTRAEVLVPKERLKPASPPSPGPTPEAPAPAPSTAAPLHPPWTHPPEEWSRDVPLLAPQFDPSGNDTTPGARTDLPTIFTGRVYAQSTVSEDRERGDSRYLSASTGAELHLENPLGRAGALDARMDFFRDSFRVAGSPDETNSTFAVRQLSYVDGGTPEVPTRWEVGRFLQHEFPELGTVDGVDWSYRMKSGSRIGVNAGGFPEPDLETSENGDAQATLYYRWVADSTERFSLGAAYQDTLHDGKQDRNLFLGTVDYSTGAIFSVHSALWLDYYGSEDTLKSQGVELTECQAQAAWRFERDGGFGVSALHRKVPEMLRDEFATDSADFVKDSRYDRVGLSGWKSLGEHGRTFGNADLWQDQDDAGARGELGLAWRELVFRHGEIGLSAFTVDGSFSSGEGMRVFANQSLGRVFWTLGYEFTNYDQKDFFGSQSTLAHNALTGTIDIDLGKRWNLSLFGDDRFGDQLDSYSLGFLLQRRF